MARQLKGGAQSTIPASAEACYAVLEDVERWPQWYERVRSIEVLERDPAGTPAEALLEAIVLRFELRLRTRVALDPPRAVALERVAHGSGGEEGMRLAVALEPAGDSCLARAEVDAQVDLPRLVPLPRSTGDRFAADLLAALERRVAG